MKNITVEELKNRMKAGHKLNIIDVREESEYNAFNIGGKLIPLCKISNMDIEDIQELKDEEIILHCKGGGRSTQACLLLEEAGFTNVINLTGGITAWQKMG